MLVLEGLLYTKDHEWVRVEGDMAFIGITDYAQSSLGDVVYVELPDLGTKYQEEDVFGVVESVKTASDIYMPVSGEVVSINDGIVKNPEGLNEEPYENWLIQVRLSDPKELEKLMDSQAYKELV